MEVCFQLGILQCSTKFVPSNTIPKIEGIGINRIVSFDTSWMTGVTSPRNTVEPRKIKMASSFFRYFPRWTNPCALIVYRKLEMKVTKIPVSINALSSKSTSAIIIGIVTLFLSLMNSERFLKKRLFSGSVPRTPQQGCLLPR